MYLQVAATPLMMEIRMILCIPLKNGIVSQSVAQQAFQTIAYSATNYSTQNSVKDYLAGQTADYQHSTETNLSKHAARDFLIANGLSAYDASGAITFAKDIGNNIIFVNYGTGDPQQIWIYIEVQ